MGVAGRMQSVEIVDRQIKEVWQRNHNCGFESRSRFRKRHLWFLRRYSGVIFVRNGLSLDPEKTIEKTERMGK